MSSVGRRIKRAMDGQHKISVWRSKREPLPLFPVSPNPEAYLFPIEYWAERQLDGGVEARGGGSPRRRAIAGPGDSGSLLREGLVTLRRDDLKLIGEDDKARADLIARIKEVLGSDFQQGVLDSAPKKEP